MRNAQLKTGIAVLSVRKQKPRDVAASPTLVHTPRRHKPFGAVASRVAQLNKAIRLMDGCRAHAPGRLRARPVSWADEARMCIGEHGVCIGLGSMIITPVDRNETVRLWPSAGHAEEEEKDEEEDEDEGEWEMRMWRRTH